MKVLTLTLLMAVFCQSVILSTPFLLIPAHHVKAELWWGSGRNQAPNQIALWQSASPTPSPQSPSTAAPPGPEPLSPKDKNAIYIEQLIENLSGLLDKYILTGSPITRERVFNVLDQIASQSKENDELVKQAIRMVKRAGVPLEKTFLDKFQSMTGVEISGSNSKELGKNDLEKRKREVEERKKWEAQYQQNSQSNGGKSALTRRTAKNGRPDLMMNSVLPPDAIATVANSKEALQKELSSNSETDPVVSEPVSDEMASAAANKASELVALAGAGFEGDLMGIGGLDDVLSQIKRRIWTPLAAPPQLLEELGIHPVRGLLLYGKPGCGKTLLARALGSILSPMRPVTVVSGPEILDKFVGSSEKNLREIFDNPPDIYDKFRIGELDGGQAIERASLHVVIMDEFDSIARARGGRGGKGEQGDAGVARDSVVNQMLAKMDGVHPLPVPTLVIGLTNKRSLVEPALLRPGRFEVQIEVPPPRTSEQRISILKVHTKKMNEAGRILVKNAAEGTAAAHYIEANGDAGLLTYDELLAKLAEDCTGFSGAALAGVARAASSHALERAVDKFSHALTDGMNGASILDCVVTTDDFESALDDVRASMGDTDYADEEIPNETNSQSTPIDEGNKDEQTT